MLYKMFVYLCRLRFAFDNLEKAKLYLLCTFAFIRYSSL